MGAPSFQLAAGGRFAPSRLLAALGCANRGTRDALTGLATRTALERRVGELAARPGADGRLAVLVLDVYRFGSINETWGWKAGDAVLVELARRLRALGGSDMLARVGADSIGVLLRGAAAEDWRGVVERMIKSLREPFVVGASSTRKLSASVGCALYPQDATSASRQLGLAEAAVFSQAERDLQRRSEQLDAYGDETAETMTWLQRFLGPQLPRLNEEFLEALGLCEQAPEGEASGLPARDAVELLPGLGGYVPLLLAPGLRQARHREHAEGLGRLLAALGLPAQAGVGAMGRLYQDVAGLAHRIPARLSERSLLLGTLLRRMESDIGFQHQGAEALRHELIERLRQLAASLQAARRRSDLLDMVVESLQQLPFLVCCAVYTQDARGGFVLEAQSTAHEPWSGGAAPSPHDPEAAQARGGALARSWLRAGIELGPDIGRAARQGRDWAVQLLARGVRSSVAVPVLDVSGNVLVVLQLYGRLPGQFNTQLMRHALDSLRASVAAELARVGEGIALPAVAADERALWRQRLFAGGLRMFMQPIVDLRLQRCTRVEALARLQLDERTLLTPGRFLPVLGQHELDRLFLEGLHLSLQSLVDWERQGLKLDLSLNLPPSTLRHADCVDWVRSALERRGIDPRRLSLEILEDRDVATQATMRDTTDRLRALGVRLALDDLGAGYSSLLRLNSLPIDMVKVDQGLVHGIVANNPRAVPLVTGLVDLARRLDLGITIEGLETQILLEYAQYLQADFGQGMAISPPLEPRRLPAWLRGWRLPPLSGIAPFASMFGPDARATGRLL